MVVVGNKTKRQKNHVLFINLLPILFYIVCPSFSVWLLRFLYKTLFYIYIYLFQFNSNKISHLFKSLSLNESKV
jgi:hypothetical protein